MNHASRCRSSLYQTGSKNSGSNIIELKYRVVHLLHASIHTLQASAGALGMVAAAAAATRCQHYFSAFSPSSDDTYQIARDVIPSLVSACTQLVVSFTDELEARHLFIMSPIHSSYYDPADPLFGNTVADSFPSASLEIEDAGKCRAVSRWTACVMHLMRALETPLNELAKHFDVKVGQNWNTALNEIEAKLKEVSKKIDGDQEEQWASEASAHLRAIKNAWRNHAQHGKARYNEEDAVAIWGNVQSFMRTLAARLSE